MMPGSTGLYICYLTPRIIARELREFRSRKLPFVPSRVDAGQGVDEDAYALGSVEI
jgi:hypothetical protein